MNVLQLTLNLIDSWLDICRKVLPYQIMLIIERLHRSHQPVSVNPLPNSIRGSGQSSMVISQNGFSPFSATAQHKIDFFADLHQEKRFCLN